MKLNAVVTVLLVYAEWGEPSLLLVPPRLRRFVDVVRQLFERVQASARDRCFAGCSEIFEPEAQDTGTPVYSHTNSSLSDSMPGLRTSNRLYCLY